MKQVQELLLSGRAHAARERLAMLLQQHPDKAEAAADALLKILQSAYTDFALDAVDEFLDNMELELPQLVTARLHPALAPRLAATRDWTERLRGVTLERLGRECRKAIVMNEPRQAAAIGLKLLARTAEGPERNDAIAMLARGLGDLVQDRERAAQALGLMQKNAGPLAAAVQVVIEQFQLLVQQGGPRGFDTGDQAWQRQLTEAILSLREFVPQRTEAGEPAPEQTERFFEVLHAILRGGLAAGDLETFTDALTIVSEYGPTEGLATAHVAGVEDRMFIQLGPRAKLVAVRAMTRLGEIAALRKTLERYAAAPEGQGRTKLLCSVMGGMGHPDFFPLLSRLLTHPADDMDEAWAIDALGRLAMPQAADLFLKRLAEAVKKIGERGNERRSRALLVALGRVARVGRTRGLVTAEQRNQIIHKTLQIVAPLERALRFKAVEELFTGRLEEVDERLKAAAAELCVDVMWGQPLRLPDAATGSTANGWREPMVAVLKRLGADALPEILQAAAKHASQYSGAMGALANALDEISDARALPLLETMVRVGFLQSDSPAQSKLLQERVYDGATQQLKDLDRDELIHGLLFTIANIGGEDGRRVIMDYADQVQAGRIAAPGDLTTRILLDTKLKYGKLGEVTVRAHVPEMDEKVYKTALSDARGGLLTKKEKRIAALATLGQARRIESIPLLLECLGDKDPMVSGAAQTALGQFMHPLPPADEFNAFCETLFAKPSLFKERVIEPLLGFIKREVPKNQPFSKIFARQVEIALEDGALVHRIRAAAAPATQPARPPETLGSPLTGGGEDEDAKSPVGAGRELSELDKKRAYLQARKEWIARGKAGDPPTPPK